MRTGDCLADGEGLAEPQKDRIVQRNSGGSSIPREPKAAEEFTGRANPQKFPRYLVGSRLYLRQIVENFGGAGRDRTDA